MGTLKYKVIKSDEQYDEYCRILHDLDFSKKKKSKSIEEEIDLLVILIEKYDEEHNIFNDLNPVELLLSLMKDHKLKSVDLARKLNVSPGLISDIINYKKGFSKEMIRRLASLFKMTQEAFNRPYPLQAPAKSPVRKTTIAGTPRPATAKRKQVRAA